MPRQYAREPLSSDEGNRLIQACETLRERIAWEALKQGFEEGEQPISRRPS
jgi:hypothetical protein